ncbi:hypothetical protein LOTGIDRAFT_228270 [Lottia gigantea]|uniref:Double jelly roll-like domain-containing protein n=1 Tax=Lottia gigantea TaxID=225164 RepID=V4C7H9_LOTGI|nr:hypothetical protein LOTGIDRAFT_228270 [Lottia gigantea]ESO97649.1 hypothetical protein LOTGIDRAFT_228270 [Lottia gigantea]
MDIFSVFRVTVLGTLICFYGVECGIAGCYTDYQQCYSTYSQVPRPQSMTVDWTEFCNAADTLDNCLKNDVNSCGPNDSEPQAYTNYAATAADSKKSCKVAKCTNMQLKCSSEYANATSFIRSESGITQENLASMCKALPKARTCYSNYLTECNEPELTTGMNDILQSIDQQLSSCQSQVSGDCLAKSLQCVNVTQEIMPSFQSLDFNNPSAMLQQMSTLCPVFGRLKECYNGLVAACPSFVNDSAAALNGFQIFDQFCGTDLVNCAVKIQECSAPIEAYPNCTDTNNADKLSLAEGVNCCKLAANTTKCLRDGGCGNIISSVPSLQRSEALCRGYNDYCPEMFECFEATYPSGSFNDPSAVCRNVGGFLTCIEQKCANKPKMGQQTLAKIREVFNQICEVIAKYPTVASCQSFTSCIDKAPSLPGTVNSIQSFVSAQDSDRWCQLAKSYVSCGVTAAEGDSCNPGAGFPSDASTVQTSTDQACSGVRGPCLPVSNCLATLMGNQTNMMFKTTCPNIPGFVTCTDDALKGCGDGSRVNAAYSLSDVKDLYVETCDAVSEGLYQCSLMSNCLDLQLPTKTGDLIYELSDQTSWCREMVLEAGSNPIETIKHPGEFDTMLKTVLYLKDFDSVSSWIPDVGDGSVLKEPKEERLADPGSRGEDSDGVEGEDESESEKRRGVPSLRERLPMSAGLGVGELRARLGVWFGSVVALDGAVSRNGYVRVLQYNNVVENNRWGNYVNWKLYPLFGLLEHRKVSIGLPYKIHLQREINDDKIFFGENGSDAKLEIKNLQLFIPVITPSIEVETRIFNSLTKDIEIAFLHRNTVGSMTLTGESTTWPITDTIKPARYLMVGFKNLADSQANNNNVLRVAMNQTQDPLIHKFQVRLNNDNYPNQPLTINPTTKEYNELYRNYKNMCELFGNPPQFEYVDFALNHPIFCFDLSAHQEDLFKTGVNINIHIEKHKEIDDIDLERIDANAKEGGFLPFLPPLIFGGIAAATGITKAVNSNKAAAVKERRHNLAMEKEARGSGVGEMIGTIKEFGKRFGEETKKTVKQGLNKLVDSIDTGEVKVKHKGNGIFFKNIHTGEGIFLSKYKLFLEQIKIIKNGQKI